MDNHRYWEDKLADYTQEQWVKRPSIFATQSVSYFPSQGSILELAGGQGQDSEWFASQGFHVTYSDFVDKVVQQVRERTSGVQNITCTTADLSKELPFSPERFDVVYSHMGLHYFDRRETRRILTNIHGIVQSRGTIALLLNTVDDPEIREHEYKQIEEHTYEDPRSGLQKSYFSVEYLLGLSRGLFKPLLLDHQGRTYKDDVKTLVRFVGEKE